MAFEVTLKRIGFKPGRTEQPGVIAELVSQVISIEVVDVRQPQLPLESSNGAVHDEDLVAVRSRGRRRRGTRADATEGEEEAVLA
jgi:hypothetical protein